MNRFAWKHPSIDCAKIQHLHDELKINPILCGLLVQRNIFSLDEAQYFFRPHLSPHLYSPFLLKDMGKAIERIIDALNHNQKILIYGDYDVDGITSISILYEFLKNELNVSNDIITYIPDRNLEGYGISEKGLNFIIEQNTHLLITVDCGSSEKNKISFLKSKNIDTIICDHHSVTEDIADVIAFINPKQKNCNYPFKELCGCSITFKLILALAEKLALNVKAIFEKYIDWVSIATIADIVELKNENRLLVTAGLRKINQNASLPIKVIKEIQKINTRLDTYHIGFSIAPLINAAGRMNHAQLALRFLLCKDIDESKKLAKELQSLNNERKELDNLILNESLESSNIQENKFSIVVYESHWHKGLLGIVASKLVEKFHKPTIVLTLQDNVWTGSGRSIEEIDLHHILCQCQEHLLHFGGHYFAAGLSVKPDRLKDFVELFEQLIAEALKYQKKIPSLYIEQELSFQNISEKFYNILQQMYPFGKGNEEPLFYSKGVTLTAKNLLKEVHASFEWKQEQFFFKSILFQNAEHYFPSLEIGKKYDIAYKLIMNDWKQQKELRLQIIDIKNYSQ